MAHISARALRLYIVPQQSEGLHAYTADPTGSKLPVSSGAADWQLCGVIPDAEKLNSLNSRGRSP